MVHQKFQQITTTKNFKPVIFSIPQHADLTVVSSSISCGSKIVTRKRHAAQFLFDVNFLTCKCDMKACIQVSMQYDNNNVNYVKITR